MGSNGTYSIDAISNTNKSWGPKADGSNMLKYFDGVERPYLIIPDNTSAFSIQVLPLQIRLSSAPTAVIPVYVSLIPT